MTTLQRNYLETLGNDMSNNDDIDIRALDCVEISSVITNGNKMKCHLHRGSLSENRPPRLKIPVEKTAGILLGEVVEFYVAPFTTPAVL